MTPDLLPLDLPVAARPVARAPVQASIVCCECGSPEWSRCEPGVASTAELYRQSNIVALRADDGVAARAFCMGCDPMVRHDG